MRKIADIWLPENDNDWLTAGGWVDPHGRQRYQNERVAAALEHLPRDRRGLAVDVGAHAGLWTMQLARHFKSVLAFEPVPTNIECWHANCDGAANARLIEQACGATPNKVELYRPSNSLSWRTRRKGDVVDAPDAPIKAGRRRLAVTVPVTTIDQHADQRIDLVKIDVEGWEYEVLQGARNAVLAYRPVIIIEEKHDLARRASAFLQGLGMVCAGKMKNDLLWIWPR